MAEQAGAFAERFDVGLLALSAQGEGPVDDAVRARCEVVRVVERRSIGASPAAAWRERRRFLLAAQRLPGWAIGHAVSDARSELERLVADWRPDVVQLEFLVLEDLARAVPRGGPPVVIVDHDARPGGSSESRWRRLRQRAAAVADAFVVFTDADRAVLERDVGSVPIEVIAPGLDLPPAANGAVVGQSVVFVGGHRHPPNLEAARHLVEIVHPRVRSRVPGASLTLVGPDPRPELATGQGVIVTGMVPDLAGVLAAAAVIVAPVERGGGMRVKVLDALAAGKALVASPRAVEGLDLRDGEHVLVAEGDEATADAIVRLLLDSGLRRRLEAAGRAWAERSLAWSTRVEAYDDLYRRLLAGRDRK